MAQSVRQYDVAVVGLGYIGLPLATCFADAGLSTLGVDVSEAARAAAALGAPAFFEPGLPERLAALPPGALDIADRLPAEPPAAVVICVGTPLGADYHEPDLRQLRAAAEQVAAAIGPDTLVVVRSTVPVGTCRNNVLPVLRQAMDAPLLAFCPERTIQGRAMAEIVSLPQVIGGLDERSRDRAAQLFASIAADRVPVSSLEAAELIKLICNTHTDVLYGFGNEVALLAEHLGLNAHEVIRGANLRYPRPDLARPGFVGGSCLTKDPYLLAYSGRGAGYLPPLAAAARAVNEEVVPHAVRRVLKTFAARGLSPSESKMLICGVAYKGRPATDDVRGGAVTAVIAGLGPEVRELVGHDFVVPPERIASVGLAAVDLTDGLRDAQALLILNDHPGYAELTADELRSLMRPRPIVFDMWGVLCDRLADIDDIDYLQLGVG